MRLISVEVNNFKSFSGQQAGEQESTHLIGPFTQFTGIIGPNGVGKSNIFDAIAFALNLNLAPGKARHARELAHIPKAVSESSDSVVNCSKEFFVKLNLVKTDLITHKSEKLSIQRGLKCKTDLDGN